GSSPTGGTALGRGLRARARGPTSNVTASAPLRGVGPVSRGLGLIAPVTVGQPEQDATYVDRATPAVRDQVRPRQEVSHSDGAVVIFDLGSQIVMLVQPRGHSRPGVQRPPVAG